MGSSQLLCLDQQGIADLAHCHHLACHDIYLQHQCLSMCAMCVRADVSSFVTL